MKILAVAANFDRCEASMLQRISASGIEVAVVTEENGRFNELLGDTIKERHILSLTSRLSIRGIRRLRAIIKKSKPDILHLFSARAVSNGLIASWSLPVKRIAYRGTMGHLSRLDPSSHLSFLHPGLHKIICVSHAVEDYLASVGVPASRRITIHKGHDISWYQSTESYPHKTDFGIPINAVVIGCVANARPVKGVDILIRAFSALPSDSEIYLLLIGELRDQRIKELLEASPNKTKIITAGYRSNASQVVGVCDIFVMPSIAREGLPKALIEAMAQGIAPIVSNVGGMPEVVTDGVHGLVVPPSNIEALRDAMLLLVRDPALRKTFSERGPARIEEAFNIKMTVEQTIGVYRSLN